MGVLDDSFDPRNWSSVLLFDAAALSAIALEFIFGVTVLASVSSSPCRLQPAVCPVISPAGVFLGVLSTFAFLGVADCLFRSHLLDVIGDAVEGVSDFSLRENTYM